MIPMLRRLAILIAILLAPLAARANQNAQGWCENGAQVVVTSGINSTTKVQKSFPSCTVTVFLHGGGLATIFSDDVGTPLANPFLASANGRWQFYAANGRYDVRLSNTNPALNVTYSDILLADPANQGASVPNTNLPFSATPSFNATNNASYTMPLTGNVVASSVTGTPANGNILILNLCQDAIGGRTFAFPPPFVIPSTFSFALTPNACNYIAFKFDGAQWTFFTGTGSSSGGGGTPGGTAGDVQCNVAGSFGACSLRSDGITFKVAEDSQFAGPNPSFDIRAFGAYASAAVPVETTGTIGGGSSSLALASAIDFANGQGILIYGAGPATPLSTPPPIALVSPSGILNGVTSRTYTLIAEDRNGGFTAAPATTSISTGAATLGNNTISLTGAVRLNGTTTYTCAANCNLQVGSDIAVAGFTVNSTLNGNLAVSTTPLSTTFTVIAGPQSDATETGGTYTALVRACDIVAVQSNATSAYYGAAGQGLTNRNNIKRFWLYQTGVGPVATAGGHDPWFSYCGLQVTGLPPNLPAVAPGAAQAQYLSTTIASGGGTTTLTLAAPAATGVTTAATRHDNGPAIRLATQAAFTAGGGTVYIPSTPLTAKYFVTNSSLDFTQGFTFTGTPAITIQNNGFIYANDTWFPRTGMTIGGTGKAQSALEIGAGGNWEGTANPMFSLTTGGFSSVNYRRIDVLLSNTVGQVAFLGDEQDNTSNVSADKWTDISVAGGANDSTCLLVKSAAFLSIDNFTCSVNTFPTPNLNNYPIRFTLSSTATKGAGLSQGITSLLMNNTTISGYGMQIDSIPNRSTPSGFNALTFNNFYVSNQATPFLRMDVGVDLQNQITYNNADVAALGNGTPGIDTTGSSRLGDFTLLQPRYSGSTLYIGSSGNLFTTHPISAAAPTNIPYFQLSSNQNLISNQINVALNNGAIGYQMPVPSAPTSATAVAGGTLIAGTYCYRTTAVDKSSFETTASLASNICATVGGANATINVVLPATFPDGAVGLNLYRTNGVGVGSNRILCPSPSFLVPGATFADDGSGGCGQNSPSLNLATYASLSVVGVTGFRGNFQSFASNVVAKTANYTTTKTDSTINCNAASGAIAISLSNANAVLGQIYTVKKTDATANACTLTPTSGTIDGVANLAISTAQDSAQVKFDGTNWGSL